MFSRSLITALLPLALLVTGCATRVTLYNGKPRPETHLALLPYDEAQREIRVTRVDGHQINGAKPTIEMLPGYHTLQIVYTPSHAVRSYPVHVRIFAQAGHRYALTAKMLNGSIDGDGVWAGKYSVRVYDLIGKREVGRSAGPGEPGAPASVHERQR